MKLSHGSKTKKGMQNGCAPLCVKFSDNLLSFTLMQNTPTHSERDPCPWHRVASFLPLIYEEPLGTITEPNWLGKGTRACMTNIGEPVGNTLPNLVDCNRQLLRVKILNFIFMAFYSSLSLCVNILIVITLPYIHVVWKWTQMVV